jgi:hypothetical protein
MEDNPSQNFFPTKEMGVGGGSCSSVSRGTFFPQSGHLSFLPQSLSLRSCIKWRNMIGKFFAGGII